MDMDSAPSGRAAMRELRGPRPPPLKVRKDSHKICKKPPVAPPPPLYHHRPPIIIYARSPKVVHTTPGEFMSVVQRLTGAAASSSSRLRDVLEKKINEHVAAKDVDDGARGCAGAGILSLAPWTSLPRVSPNHFSGSDVSPRAASCRGS